MSTDAIVVLREEHKEIKRLFRRFEKAEKPAEKQKIVGQILEMLAVHTYIENEGLYPKVREMVPDIESDILESYEEHHVADLLCAELAEMSPDDERYSAKVTVLIESVEHHIDEEESSWFPDVREALGRKQLQEIGAEMIELRKTAPREPKMIAPRLVDRANAQVPAPRPAPSSTRSTRRPTRTRVVAAAHGAKTTPRG
nr:hemerythrin domain-containing protein [Sporichthya polymorpha]